MDRIDQNSPLFDESLRPAQRLAYTFARLHAGGRDLRAAHALRGTVRSRRVRRYQSGYNPAMSGAGGTGDRLSHRLGRP